MVTDIFILGLLTAQPLSGYDIQQYLELSAAEHWADVLPGSIYYALNKLERHGFVSVDAVERTGRRERATFKLTPAGRDELRGLLRKALRTPVRVMPSLLYTALSFAHELDVVEVLSAFDAEIERLEHEIEFTRQGEAVKVNVPGAPPFMAAIFANSRAHLEADLALLRRLRVQLSTESPKPPELTSLAELRSQARSAKRRSSRSKETGA